MIKQLFNSIGGRILLIVTLGIVLTLATSLYVIYHRTVKTVSHGLELEMRSILVQAEATTDSIGEMSQAGAFDYAKLSEELKTKGKENYKDTTFYKTIPVVAAWSAVGRAIEGTPIKFHVVRNDPRNKNNLPDTDLDRSLLKQVESEGKDEVFVLDEKAGMIAYARPVVMSQSCMACHGSPSNSVTGDGKDILGFQMENWKPGERRGAYILTVPMSELDGPVREGMIQAVSWSLPTALAS